ncbi:ABC transporter permease [Oleiagrimonas soli]|uniref:Peptide ABC transporter permease n=1 Tax=Oleiagrimonas soli TaxID=1543381 RepID=A0A099CX95_9GAMM|nr:FtsX-like permease family protein [Oleiagrimonas soli]KGI78588.1 peptide ABC transporter permease [Oleiagrimonas soli]MBB6184123.1 putative ABC transport system permease protein [Oleiagrimonas soli]
MQIKPILSALRHHKAGTILIAVQIALTLAIVCNALFIIQQRITMLTRSTGIDEAHLIRLQNQWVGVDDKHVGSLMQTDLDTLRRLPGVADAYATNSTPLSNGGWSTGIGLKPGGKGERVQTAIYFADDHTLDTLGLKLVAGRNFRSSEVVDQMQHDGLDPPQVIVTRAVADKFFPDGDAVGKRVYLGNKPSIIVGVVARLQVPWVGGWAANWEGRSTLVPRRLMASGTNFVIRAKDGQIDKVLHSAPAALLASDRMRVIPDDDGVVTFAQMRQEAYQSDRGMAILMGVICVVLLGITAAGIVGLTSFWVGQRRKQIGVRRALGATRRDILSYFLTENLLIGATGVVLGMLLAVGMNQWLMNTFEMQRLSWPWIVSGVIVLLALGQAAVLAPAIRASRVPPVVATRTV